MFTVPTEELLKKSGSVFKLVLIASQRAAELNIGAHPRVDVSRAEKNGSVALREIAEGKVEVRKELAE
ncbi:MAG: DNA-directed RNA polymerase subunit omega [Candidatus Omnitrophica bacterium]|nr:DNA-directed RNA polymerase subunit omega [Candidatus Omnitrophota bacterium]